MYYLTRLVLPMTSLNPLINPITNADKIGFMIMYTSLFLVTYLTYAWLRPFNHSATEKES